MFRYNYFYKYLLVTLSVYLGFIIYFHKVSAEEKNNSDLSSQKEILYIATAANFTKTLEQISSLYEKQNPNIHVQITSGASAILANQIKMGLPIDIFFSADKKYIEDLNQDKKIQPTTIFNFSVGKLVFWMPHKNIKDLSADEINKILQNEKRPISVADKNIAPFGFAAFEYIKNTKLENNSNFIYARNIEQAANYIYSGAASCGFVSLSTIINMNKKSELYHTWVVPQNLYTPIVQQAAMINRNKPQSEKLAKEYIKFFQHDQKVKNIITSSGYSLPENNFTGI